MRYKLPSTLEILIKTTEHWKLNSFDVLYSFNILYNFESFEVPLKFYRQTIFFLLLLLFHTLSFSLYQFIFEHKEF